MAGPRLTDAQRRALEILDHSRQHGATEAFMLAHGLWRELLAKLVLAGFATVVTETIRTGGPPIKVERYRITDDGRTAIEG